MIIYGTSINLLFIAIDLNTFCICAKSVRTLLNSKSGKMMRLGVNIAFCLSVYDKQTDQNVHLVDGRDIKER